MTHLTHLDESGAARMVDVGDKPATERRAVATGRLIASDAALAALRDGTVQKGDALAVARVAGIMAAKRTADLIPLCHPLSLSAVKIEITLGDHDVGVTATVRTRGPTGVEMEALTAATVALLTLYDMLKAVDRAMIIGDVRLLEKAGGRSGNWNAVRKS